MGSKRSMLLNGLGEALAAEVPKSRRFVDLFTGSGAVAWHVGQKYAVPVIATDLQNFCVALAGAVTTRTHGLELDVFSKWLADAEDCLTASAQYLAALNLQKKLSSEPIEKVAEQARNLCVNSPGVISRAYGGYYYSPLQALKFDALRQTQPHKGEISAVALAGQIWAASRCAASPGHTAQPFKANDTAGKYLLEAWLRDPFVAVTTALKSIAPLYANTQGQALQSDARDVVSMLDDGDLAFLDPPYSGVHYSRFYHVLETLTNYEDVEVSGAGRYPPREQRPQSKYSVQTEAAEALHQLLSSLSQAGCKAIVTFPAGKASNGLSGDSVREIADRSFHIKSAKVSGRFSTLGGNLRNRDARQTSEELILNLSPR